MNMVDLTCMVMPFLTAWLSWAMEYPESKVYSKMARIMSKRLLFSGGIIDNIMNKLIIRLEAKIWPLL